LPAPENDIQGKLIGQSRERRPDRSHIPFLIHTETLPYFQPLLDAEIRAVLWYSIMKMFAKVLPALIVCLCCGMLVTVGACKRTRTASKAGSGADVAGDRTAPETGSEQRGPFNPAMDNCAGFTAQDAASVLGVPAEAMTAQPQELYAGSWKCSFSGGDKTLAFTVTAARSVEEASRRMEQYRAHLRTTGSAEPFKANLPNGAYADVRDVGDEAVWTDMNFSLTARRGNVSIRVLMPKDRRVQIEAARKFLEKL
jgi:uncharacterized protein with GYD domain